MSNVQAVCLLFKHLGMTLTITCAACCARERAPPLPETLERRKAWLWASYTRICPWATEASSGRPRCMTEHHEKIVLPRF